MWWILRPKQGLISSASTSITNIIVNGVTGTVANAMASVTGVGGGVLSGASYTNWTGLSALVFPSSTGITNDALLQNEVIMYLNTNIVVGAATNAHDGRKLEYRFTCTNGDYQVTWPANSFKIPSSSTMSNVITVVSNTTSFFSVEWNAGMGKWMMQSYVYGY